MLELYDSSFLRVDKSLFWIQIWSIQCYSPMFTGYLPPNKNLFTLRTSPFGTIKRGQVPEKTKYKYVVQ